MDFFKKDIISLNDLTREEIDFIIDKSFDIKQNKYSNALQKVVLANLFYEPSTRTRLSFESAITRLGGKYISVADAVVSSVRKGETLKDTIKTICGYCDIIAIRHNLEGAARAASEVSSVPIINAGDGSNQHPTQALLDLFTVKEHFGNIDNLNICLLGDLRYGRTVHSLSVALSYYNVNLWLISPKILTIPEHFRKILDSSNTNFAETEDLFSIPDNIDVIYTTRIQKERFADQQDYEKVSGSYKITPEIINTINPQAVIMHPLPRVDEISVEVDTMPNALYFHQAHNGIFVRQALIGLVTGTIK